MSNNNIFSLSKPAFDYTTQNPGIITNGLVCYYSFENPNSYIGNGPEVKDLNYPLGNTGQLSISSAYAYNINTGSMIFNGDSLNPHQIQCSMVGFTNFTSGSISVCHWSNYMGAEGSQGIAIAGGLYYDGFQVLHSNRVFQSGIQNNFGGNTGLEWYSDSTGEFISSNVSTSGGWHYWVTTVGNGTINWYKDGNLINTTTSVPALSFTDNPFMQIGSDLQGTEFNGLINSIQIYNRVLTSSEIAYNYSAGKWRFML